MKRIKNMFQQNKLTTHVMNIWNNYTKIDKHASSQQKNHKKFMQLSLKPKSPSLREYQRGRSEIWECENMSLLEHKRVSKRGFWILGGIPYL